MLYFLRAGPLCSFLSRGQGAREGRLTRAVHARMLRRPGRGAGGFVSETVKTMGVRRVVLSHSSKDKADIQRLRVALGDRGVSAWEDVLELRLGAKLGAIREAIREADGLVLLLTPASIGSDWVQREAQWALVTKLERPGFVLLPLLTMPLAIPLGRSIVRDHGAVLNGTLAATARLLLLFGTLFAIGIVL